MALVNRKHNFIFFHGFKMAGNSVREVLKPFDGNVELHGVHVNAADVHKHFSARQWDDLWDKMYKFTFIRNPFDWVVSTYFYIRRSKGHGMYDKAMNMNFPQFTDWWCKNAFHMDRPYGSNKITTLKEFVSDENGNIIVDFIGRMETMNKDFAIVCNKLGIKDYELPIKNAGIGRNRDKDYRKYYNDVSKKLIEQYYGADLEYFKYKF